MTVGGADSGAKRAAKPIAALPPAQARAKRSYPRSCGTTKVVRFQHATHAAQAAGVVLIIILSGERRRKACPGGDGLCCQRRSRQCAGGCELREEGTTPLGSADLQGRRAADGQNANETSEHVGDERRTRSVEEAEGASGRFQAKKCTRRPLPLPSCQEDPPLVSKRSIFFSYRTYAARIIVACGFGQRTANLHARRAELVARGTAAQHADSTHTQRGDC